MADAAKPAQLQGTVFRTTAVGEGQAALKIEFDDFRLFNILDLSPDGEGKPRNVGPSVTFKVRDTAGQARDRKSVVLGKSVSVRVDLGGRRIIKKKKTI